MTVDKFGRHIDKKKSNNLLTKLVSASPTPLTLFDVQNYVEDKLKKLYGYVIFYIQAGPNKDPKSNLLLLNTGSDSYMVLLNKCELVYLHGTNNLNDVNVYLNGKLIPKNIKTLSFKRGDKISIEEIKPTKSVIRVMVFVKYPIYD